jgi:hypothetical protein
LIQSTVVGILSRRTRGSRLEHFSRSASGRWRFVSPTPRSCRCACNRVVAAIPVAGMHRSSLLMNLSRHLAPAMIRWRRAIVNMAVLPTPIISTSIVDDARRLCTRTSLSTRISLIPGRIVSTELGLVDQSCTSWVHGRSFGRWRWYSW